MHWCKSGRSHVVGGAMIALLGSPACDGLLGIDVFSGDGGLDASFGHGAGRDADARHDPGIDRDAGVDRDAGGDHDAAREASVEHDAGREASVSLEAGVVDCACACTTLNSAGGCADLCDDALDGTSTPNFCNGAPALAQCAACLAGSCGFTASEISYDTLCIGSSGCACACTTLNSAGGCADLCDDALDGSSTPNFCNGAPALSQCTACLASNCGFSAAETSDDTLCTGL